MVKNKKTKISNKKNYNNKSRNKRKIKVNNKDITLWVIMLVLAIISCFLFSVLFTVIVVIGILIILGIAKLLKKIRTKPKRKKIFNIVLIILLIIAILISIIIVGFVVKIIQDAPEFDITELDKKEASIFYDSNGNEVGRVGKEMRENVTYDDLPEVFIDALIATEDSRYFQHNGFDAPRFLKAAIGQLMGNSNAGGGSTISMQLITNTYTDPSRSQTSGIAGIIRKLEDIYLAVFKLEKNFTKEEIIEYYVNNFNLSSNAWGVEQASQIYFNKSVKDLNLSEAALLVGIFNNPTVYNPFNHAKAAYGRRSTVLSLMVRHGYITQEEADIANSIPIDSLLTKSTSSSKYQGYIDTVIEELKSKYNIDPTTTSVLVYTNMDSERQAGIEDIMNDNSSYKWINDSVTSGVAVIDVSSGKVVAIGAGHNRGKSEWNMATQETNQIGSTAKPIFDYGPAIEYLNWSTYQQVVDEEWTYSTGQSVTNSDGTYKGQMSIRDALAQSRNVPAVKTFQKVQEQVGNDKIYDFVTKLGLTPETNSKGEIYESSALGAVDGITVLQMAAAYNAFANGGTYVEPLTVNKIVYRDTNDVKTITPTETKVMSESTAYMITQMLISAVEEGISSGAKVNGVTVAAKTGTTNFTSSDKEKLNLSSDAVNDAWIVGYDPEYTIAMWYGYRIVDSKNHLHQTSAVIERGKLYRALGNVVFNKNTGKTFTQPSSVVKVCVEDGSWPAALPSSNTPESQITCEWFKSGTEPTETSTTYSKLSKVSNLKVTYDENTQKINISWSALNESTGNESFGNFGYKVYYGDVLLGFTTDNYYTIDANTNISGTYKVVTSFENYSNNQSDAATYTFTYEKEKEEEETVTPSPSPSSTE